MIDPRIQEQLKTEILRENAKAEAIQNIPGIANSLSWAADEIDRLRTVIEGAPDPAFYKPDELEGAYLKWRRAALSVNCDTGET